MQWWRWPHDVVRLAHKVCVNNWAESLFPQIFAEFLLKVYASYLSNKFVRRAKKNVFDAWNLSIEHHPVSILLVHDRTWFKE